MVKSNLLKQISAHVTLAKFAVQNASGSLTSVCTRREQTKRNFCIATPREKDLWITSYSSRRLLSARSFFTIIIYTTASCPEGHFWVVRQGVSSVSAVHFRLAESGHHSLPRLPRRPTGCVLYVQSDMSLRGIGMPCVVLTVSRCMLCMRLKQSDRPTDRPCVGNSLYICTLFMYDTLS